ncbi:prolipoprotein diacylglyceryl transferase [Natronobacterium texcoconense]|uniref:Uncharacterized protein n=1 Tax=Natronobacterium texcoconense TaxID=1095778 RepID=A0A1H1GCB0_NATTX|nr:hypothetical protein [Natronobacterium texcoconense]SDR10912.1 hypothetical protein SAMN04489842_2369 [Natronobacterium texcoconense]
MTNSTIDDETGDGGGFDVGSSGDELFGGIAEDSQDEPAVDDWATDHERVSQAVEDRTADSVFGELKADVGNDADDVLGDESPDDIIASADEPEPEPEWPVGDDLVADEQELEALLLTGRTKEQEFLWVDPADEDAATDAPSAPEETTETDDSQETSNVDDSRDTDPEPAETDETTAITPSAGSESQETDAGRSTDTREDESASDRLEEPAGEALESEAGTEVVDSAAPPTDSSTGSAPETDEPKLTADIDPDSGDEIGSGDETADAETDSKAAERDDSPGTVRRLLSQLNPF